MAQPVIDTLQVAEALRRTGMEREQAEGLARTLGTEFSEHTASRQDLDSGFTAIRAQMDTRFAEVDARFTGIEARLDVLNGQFKFVFAGFALITAILAMVIGTIGVLHANPSPAQPITLQIGPGMSVSTPGVGGDATVGVPERPEGGGGSQPTEAEGGTA